ncbi:hypothetical protein DFH07DRAFT_424664 [Mycena maculata]|uniref:F-box domain-containing protein n=1 Tax=Mycena maculata TaxID=230809 RepID=A0AAD7NHY7_9AGAR|nr:hypothetical protein DFH07DRAFT_424664 [Mycena maculata]
MLGSCRLFSGRRSVSEIANMQNLAERDLGTKSSTTATRNTPETRLSLLSIIPPELLAEIFSLAVLSGPIMPDPACARARTHMKWVLAHVCNRSRAIAFSLPRLWTEVDIHFCGKHGSPETYSAAILQAQLERSRHLPLHIVFDCDLGLGHLYTASNAVAAHQVLLLRQLIGHCARWATVMIRGRDPILSVLAEVKGGLPHLAELGINTLGSCPDFQTTAADAFADAPNLRVVFINQNPHLGSLPGALTVDSTRIERYAGWNTWAGHAAVLQRCAATLRACCLDTASVEPSPVVVLPALRTLCVRRATILQFVTAPALEEFMGCGTGAVPIISFLEHSGCALKRLVMCHTRGTCASRPWTGNPTSSTSSSSTCVAI